MTYTISYEKNGVYQAIGVNAQTAEQAAAYFAQYKPAARFIGIREGMESKPGFPVITVPADFRDEQEAQEAQEAQKKPIRKEYTYTEGHHHEVTTSAHTAMEWHRMGRRVTVWGHRPDGSEYHVRIPGASQPEQEDKNHAHCKHIARELEAYADGNVYRCPECGEIHRFPDSVGDEYRCPDCGTVNPVEEWEQLGMWDFFADCYDVELRVGIEGDYRSAKIMVACGGPNIYVDTADAMVKLYWWSDRAEYPISYDARDAVDEFVEEWRDCR